MLRSSLLLLVLSFPAYGEWYLDIEYEHISSPMIKESGYGLNSVFVDLVYQSDNFYLFGGLGLHDESSDCPEVCFGDNSLGRFGFGLRFKL